jgi:hypothetical protein
LLAAVKTHPKLRQSALLGGTQQAVFPSWGGALSSLRGLLFVGQPLAEQTPQPRRLRALQRDPDARVFVADLGVAKTVERQEQRLLSLLADRQTVADPR